MWNGKISVGLDRAPKPRDSELVTFDQILRRARVGHPDISHGIARTEAKGLDDVSLCFFGATDKHLSQSRSSREHGRDCDPARAHAHIQRCRPRRAWCKSG